MNTRFFDWIWHVRGTLPIAPEQSGGDVLGKLDPLFHAVGTSHQVTADTLTFSKKDPAAQDKMSVFDRGVLRIEKGMSGAVLYYNLTSRALLFCFLAPLLFIGFAQLTILTAPDKPAAEASDKPDKKDTALPQNAIDKWLGAPAPEKPETDPADRKKPSPTAAYVFAALFAVLYLVGRVLEAKLVKSLFRKRLREA